MSSDENILVKFREQRVARERARLERLRQLNLKKYSQNDFHSKNATTSASLPNSKFGVSSSTTKPISAIPIKTVNYVTANKNLTCVKSNLTTLIKPNNVDPSKVNETDGDRLVHDRNHIPLQEIDNENHVKAMSKIPKLTVTTNGDINKSIIPQKMLKNKAVAYDKLNYKATKVVDPIKRSISVAHLKKNTKNELKNYGNKWASVGEKLDNLHLRDINEDDHVMDDRVVSAVKTERKRSKVTLQTTSNFNTLNPEELQLKLNSWLLKHGKSLESYHHLQSFGVHHLSKEIRSLNFDTMIYETNDDENKENIALESDSDNDSFYENMNVGNDGVGAANKVDFLENNWRKASSCNDSVDYDESLKNTSHFGETTQVQHVEQLFIGVLNDLTELLREGFEWEQCARWLRVVRERFPCALDCPTYWEFRAALEERRGDLPASLQCWEQAIANGSKHSVAETNLDNLLDKFMQLKISPSSGKPQVDPKLVDVKSVFKSTIIRFGIQQAKLRQLRYPVKYPVTPVRRSSRLGVTHRHMPLRVCATLKEAAELGPIEFVPNKALNNTP